MIGYFALLQYLKFIDEYHFKEWKARQAEKGL
jgi:hypothetical protein